MQAAIPGFLAGLALIVAIGAQNAYVLRLGLARNHVAVAVAICAISDAVLIAAGISGLGAIVRNYPQALIVMKWVGVAYLLWFAAASFWRARSPEVLLPSDAVPQSLRSVVLMTLGFTWLNPHVYVDTVLLLGSIGNQYGADRWWFGLGAVTASIVWFVSLGFGARWLSRWMSRPLTWRLLDLAIGVIMIAIAVRLAFADLS